MEPLVRLKPYKDYRKPPVSGPPLWARAKARVRTLLRLRQRP